MGIFHKAYFFNPEDFLKSVSPYLIALKKGEEGYLFLRSAAIEVYDNNLTAQSLAEEYGGWDRNAIITQISPYYTQEPEDVAFWLVLLLYSFCQNKKPQSIGLGDNWRLMQNILKELEWHVEDINLVIKGKKIKTLFMGETLTNKKMINEDTNFLDYVNPFSQSGQLGWLSLQEVQVFSETLKASEHKLGSVAKKLGMGIDKIEDTYRVAFDIFESAKEKNLGLCLIISG